MSPHSTQQLGVDGVGGSTAPEENSEPSAAVDARRGGRLETNSRGRTYHVLQKRRTLLIGAKRTWSKDAHLDYGVINQIKKMVMFENKGRPGLSGKSIDLLLLCNQKKGKGLGRKKGKNKVKTEKEGI